MSLTDLKEQIKQIAISDIIGRYLTVTRRGSQLISLCPFHNDSKPSLNISDQKGLFRCFACQTGGDGITFVQKYKNLEFKDALVEIAEAFGLEIPVFGGEKKADPKRDMAFKVMNAATKLYRKVATAGGCAPYQEFLTLRQLDEAVAKQFQIGFAPLNSVFSSYLETLPEGDKELAIQVATEIGLIKNYRGANQDIFRGRIIFPIFDRMGKAVALGGRNMGEAFGPKYLNSKDSFIFSKKKVLYGLNFAKSYIRQRDQILIVEGYLDLIKLHQFGFEQTVAVMGVGLSDGQCNFLKSQTQNIFLALDSDDAGWRAMERINQQFMQRSILPRLVDFCPHKDPDEFIVKEGQLALSERIEQAKSFTDQQVEQILKECLEKNADFDEKIGVLNSVFALLEPLGENLGAVERAISSAKRLGLSAGPSEIVQAYKKFIVSQQKKGPKALQKTKAQVAPEQKTVIEPAHPRPTSTKLTKLERLFVQEMVSHPECASSDEVEEILDLVGQNEVQKLVRWLRDIYYDIEDSQYIQIVNAHIAEAEYELEIRELVGSSLFRFNGEALEDKVRDKLLFDIKNRFIQDKLKRLRSSLRLKYQSDPNKLNESLSELHSIENKIQKIKQLKIHE